MSNPAGDKKAKILIVDDSKLIRTMVGKTLREKGYEVIEAINGREALLKVGTDKPDCILLDLLMPDMSGFDVLSTLKAGGLTVPSIILTADIQQTSKKKCQDLGAVDFINKPPHESDLLNSIERALGAYKR